MASFDGIIVACSRKQGGYCVVVWNHDLDHNGFRRLVWKPDSDDFGDEIPKFLINRDNYSLNVGDVITVYPDLKRHDASPIQPENMYLWQESTFRGFHKKKEYPRITNDYLVENILRRLPQNDENLFGMSLPSHRITVEEAKASGYSFTMVEVRNLAFTEDRPSRANAEPRTVASFVFNGRKYSDIRVTVGDKAEDIKRFAGRSFETAYIALSLAQPFEYDGMCYVCLCAFYGGVEK